MPLALDYAPRLPWYKRRLTRRLTTSAFVLLLIATPAWYFGPLAYRRATFLYWQQRCMSHLDPPGTIAMDSPPVSAGTFRPTTTGLPWPVPEWQRYRDSTKSAPGFSELPFFEIMIWTEGGDCRPVFLHKRTCPAGDRLVMALAHSDHADMHGAYFCHTGIEAFLIIPGTFLNDPCLPSYLRDFHLSLPLLDPDSLRIYTGQPDPADPAAFTIDFDLNGTRHTARFALTPAGDQINLLSVTPPL